MIDELKKQLTVDEGRVRWAYKDSEGYWTIGIGCLIDQAKGGGLRDVEIDFIFNNRVEEKRRELASKFPWTSTLDDARLGALLNMCFQMGVDGVAGFPAMLRCLHENDFNGAYHEALDSLWAKQTPERAKRVAKQLQTGVWQWQ